MNEQDGANLNPNFLSELAESEDGNGIVVDETLSEQTTDLAKENNRSKDAGKPRARKKRTERSFPAAPFEDALELPLAIQKFAAGQRIRRLRLFELLSRSPDSSTSRTLITNSSRYSLTIGSYAAEWIELTPEGKIATSDDVPEREKLRVWFQLAIEQIPPFKLLYDQFQNNRLPAKGIMVDFLRERGLNEDEVSECVDTFLLNAKFVGILRNMSGAERIVTIDHVLDYAPAGVQPTIAKPAQVPLSTSESGMLPTVATPAHVVSEGAEDERWSRVCFYITPIGSDGSEQRQHSDLFLGSIIEPALEEFQLDVVRADKIAEAGIITRQIIEHIMRSRLVVADLSFHNPNVFYELALRHAIGKPTVQVIRAADRVPFDVEPMRTIIIDTSSIYSLVPQLEVYRSAITSQVRRALEHPDQADNPVTAFYSVMKPASS